MAADGKQIVRRYETGKALRRQRDARVNLMAPYIDPSRRFVTNDKISEGSQWMVEVYDSQGIYANDLGALFFNGHSTNQATKWFGLKERRSLLNEEDEVKEWLEECRDRMLGDLSLSNAYKEFHELYKDWWGFGTGACLLEERPALKEKPVTGYRGLRVTVDKIGRYVIGLDGWHQPNQFMREFELTADAAVERYGEDKVSTGIQNAYQQKNYTRKFKFIHAIYPREENEKGRSYSEKMPFASCYVEQETKHVCKEGGYEQFPVMIPRQGALYGEIYGRGRGDVALNDIITLNTGMRMSFEDWALKLRPVTFFDQEAIFGALALVPGTFKAAQRRGNMALQDLFYQYQTGSHPEVSQIKFEELRKAIREAFFVDHLRELMLVQGSKDMTAYEYGRKLELVQKLIGPFYGGLQFDFHIPFINRQFDLMLRGGAFSPPPDILLENGGQIDVTFDSPLARAQKADEIQAQEMFMARLQMLVQMQIQGQGASVLDNISFDEWTRGLASDMGVPAKRIRSSKEVAQIRGSRAQAEAEQKTNEQAMMVTKGMQQMAPMVKAAQEKAA